MAGRTTRSRRASQAVRAVALLGVLTLGGCASGAAPTGTPAVGLPTPSPDLTAAPSPLPTAMPTPGPTPLLVKVTPIPGAPESATVVRISTKLNTWSVSTIIAPAGKGWTVEIYDADATHSFIAASGPAYAQRIFTSPRFDGPGTYTFQIAALPAGSYLFICGLHPATMTGTLIIR